MIRIYYHVYGINGVDEIIDEQLTSLNEIKEPFKLTVGLSVSNELYDYNHLLDKITPNVIKYNENEFLTISLIQQDKIEDDDYIFYFHTKGASKINTKLYEKESNWRKVLNYYLITKYVDVLKNLKEHNTFGFQLEEMNSGVDIYSGNFWWATGKYIKTINTDNVDKTNRYNAELNFIQNGENWKPNYIKKSFETALKKNINLI
jgi:hypothetical protein